MKSFLPIVVLLMVPLSGCKRPATPGSETQNGASQPNIPAPARPPEADVQFTRDNFQSLEFNTSGGIAGIQTQMRLENGKATYSERSTPKRSAPFSQAELDALLKVLNGSKFSKLVGSYSNSGVADGISHDISVTLRGKRADGKPLIFTVSDYADAAPPAYQTVVSYLAALKTRAFSQKSP